MSNIFHFYPSEELALPQCLTKCEREFLKELAEKLVQSWRLDRQIPIRICVSQRGVHYAHLQVPASQEATFIRLVERALQNRRFIEITSANMFEAIKMRLLQLGIRQRICFCPGAELPDELLELFLICAVVPIKNSRRWWKGITREQQELEKWLSEQLGGFLKAA